jgi:predicted nucleotidyltransferase
VENELFAILTSLAAEKVRFLVVGGIAVVLHGHPRFTADLDLVVDLQRENVTTALEVLASKGFRPRPPVPLMSFADPEARRSWIAEKGLTVFSLWSPDAPGTEVDLFVEEPFDFATAYARATFVDLIGVAVPVLSIGDLIALKRRAARPKDLADVEALEAIERQSRSHHG